MPRQSKKTSQKKKYFHAVGRRKTATATAKLYLGKGELMVNGQSIEKYFSGQAAVAAYKKPFEIVNGWGKYHGVVMVKGGGIAGQLEAVVLAFSRALAKADPEELRPLLKKEKLLRTDARVRERRKAGQMGKARKKKQSPKR